MEQTRPLPGGLDLTSMTTTTEDVDTFAYLFADSEETQDMMKDLSETWTAAGDPRADNLKPMFDTNVRDVSTWKWCMRITLAKPPIDKYLGWVISTGGTAPDKVDLLLPFPKGAAAAVSTEIENLGAVINVSPFSALLTMKTMDINSLVKFVSGDDSLRLSPGLRVTFTGFRTLFKVGGYDSALEYAVKNDRSESFFAHRDAYIRDLWPGSREYVSEQLRKLYPRPRQQMRHPGISLLTPISAGAFGLVQFAIPETQDRLLAVKKGVVRDGKTQKMWAREVGFNEQYKGLPGLLVFEDTWCLHGDKANKCGALCDEVSMVMQYAIGNFANLELFENLDNMDRLEIYYRTLEGLYEIEKSHVIHRDLTDLNMVIVSIWPEVKAAIIDFGKAIQAITSSDIHIAPMSKCAPEVGQVARDETEFLPPNH